MPLTLGTVAQHPVRDALITPELFLVVETVLPRIWGMSETQIMFFLSTKHIPLLQPQAVSSQADSTIFLSVLII